MKQKNLLFVIPLIILSLLAAVWSGWLRLGWEIPFSPTAAQHGSFMVNSFLASLIFLERAVTFRQKWVLFLPFLNALSSIGFVTGFPQIAVILFNTGSFGFVVMCSYFLVRYKEFYYAVFLLGAVCLFIGNTILLVKQDHSLVVSWWMTFLLLTIVAERLELTRFLNLSGFKKNLLTAGLLFAPVSLLWPWQSANTLMAAAFAFTACWLFRYDMARHAIKLQGQHRYSGLLLLTGYVWLFISAVLLLVLPKLLFGYDALLHSFFIGFVFSMIFSHAPIILPAVARLPVKIYRPVLYVWFVLLQLSLIMRIVADSVGDADLRRIGGGLNGVVILGFFVTIGVIVRKELAKKKLVLRKS